MRKAHLILLAGIATALSARQSATQTDSTLRIVSGLPKSGTHLLKKVAEALTGTRATWIKRYSRTYRDLTEQAIEQAKRTRQTLLSAHLHGTAENVELIKKYDIRTVFVYRDPRDQAVSLAYYLHRMNPRARQMFANNLFNLGIGDERLSREELLTLIISKLPESYAFFMPLADEENILAIRFEDLVGTKGGGSDEASLRTIEQITEKLLGTIDEKRIQTVAHSLFGGTMTFRKGKIGQWKDEFTEEQKALCKEVAGQLLIDLGYENDFDW